MTPDLDRKRSTARQNLTQAAVWLKVGQFQRAIDHAEYALELLREVAEEAAKCGETAVCGIDD